MNKNLDSKKLMYSSGNNDECYTPAYGVEPILEYIPEGAIVWCPFDDESSEFVKQISKQNTVPIKGSSSSGHCPLVNRLLLL